MFLVYCIEFVVYCVEFVVCCVCFLFTVLSLLFTVLSLSFTNLVFILHCYYLFIFAICKHKFKNIVIFSSLPLVVMVLQL